MAVSELLAHAGCLLCFGSEVERLEKTAAHFRARRQVTQRGSVQEQDGSFKAPLL